MANNRLKRTGFVSDVDKFLREYDKKHPDFVESRQKEIKKFAKIFEMRDNVREQSSEDPVFRDF